ncbi:TonB family protein [Neisseria sp. Ec49-e6-T10]|uniref:TonB family protein n=1 Tax=Neisseria sp. Ec49-e6-T10 TaxID=3140744 RepID=UPI003EBA2D5B
MKTLFFTLIFFASFTHAQTTIECKVTDIINGHSFICQIEPKNLITVQLDQLIAPDLKQPYGAEAQKELEELILGKNVFIEVAKTGQHSVLGTVYNFSGYPDTEYQIGFRPVAVSVNLHMILYGNAWYDRVSNDRQNQEYQLAQEEAKQAKYGLWSISNPIPPWEWANQFQSDKASLKRASIKLEYPSRALELGIEGTVLIQATISTQGDVTTAFIYKSSGDKDLDYAAKNAVLKSKFNPEIKNGKPISETIRIPITFKLIQ